MEWVGGQNTVAAAWGRAPLAKMAMYKVLPPHPLLPNVDFHAENSLRSSSLKRFLHDNMIHHIAFQLELP